AHVREFLKDHVEDAPAFLLVLHLATAEEDADQDLVVVLQELPRLVDPGLDVVVARLGTDPNLLQLLLAGLAGLAALLRVLESELAVVEDFADRRALGRRHPHPRGARPPGPPHGPRGPRPAPLVPARAQ